MARAIFDQLAIAARMLTGFNDASEAQPLSGCTECLLTALFQPRRLLALETPRASNFV